MLPALAVMGYLPPPNDRLQVPIDGSWDNGPALTYRKLRKTFPGSCQWWQAHLVALTLIATFAAFAVFIVIYAVATGGR